jgi:riboflavin kinase/FMN adenylyltransferase
MAAMVKFIRVGCDDSPCNVREWPIFIAIGTFDGVHIGHRKLISMAVAMAKFYGGISAIYTFSPHPTVITNPDNRKAMIFGFRKKYEIIGDYGPDYIVEQQFNGQFAKILPADFVKFIKRKFPRLQGICVGENFKFGSGRIGDVAALSDCAKLLGIDVIIIPSVTIGGTRVSSSAIRKLLANGDHALANRMLGLTN